MFNIEETVAILGDTKKQLRFQAGSIPTNDYMG